jgi:hypothetical protein
LPPISRVMTLHPYPLPTTTWHPQVGRTRTSRAYSKLPTCTLMISLPRSCRYRFLLLNCRAHPLRAERPRVHLGSLQMKWKPVYQATTSDFRLSANVLLRVQPSLK